MRFEKLVTYKECGQLKLAYCNLPKKIILLWIFLKGIRTGMI